MAKATVSCTCEICDNIFIKEEFKRNRHEADAWAEWAKENCTVCPECYKKQKEQENKEKASVYNLPEIKGTEKQIAFATSLRNKWVAKRTDEIKIYLEMMNTVNSNPEKIEKLINEEMPTREAVLMAAFKAYGVQDAHIIFTCTDAHTIIDLLKY